MSPRVLGWDFTREDMDDATLVGLALQRLLPHDLGFILIRVVKGKTEESVDTFLVTNNTSRAAVKDLLTGQLEAMNAEPRDN